VPSSDIIATVASVGDRVSPIPAPADVFTALVDRHLDASYRLAAVILGTAADAEDAVHEAAVRAWTGFGGLRDLERFAPWFGRIVVNVCRDEIRARRRRPVVDLWPELQRTTERSLRAGDPTDLVAERDALLRAFDRLELDHRIVLALRYWRDLPVDAIADQLGIPSGTVKSRLNHARLRLRAELAQEDRAER
jgi:RNA polymerase sigma factor (sigma-70 family)